MFYQIDVFAVYYVLKYETKISVYLQNRIELQVYGPLFIYFLICNTWLNFFYLTISWRVIIFPN